MNHINDDVLTIKDRTCNSVMRINLKNFFPATQTTCRQLVKIIDASMEPEEIEEECVAYLMDAVRVFINGYDVTTARKYLKNITVIGGKEMTQKLNNDLAATLVELKKEQAKVAAYVNKVKELQHDLQRLNTANDDNFATLHKKLSAALAEVDELKAGNTQLQKELDELKATKPVVTLQNSPDGSTDESTADNKSKEPETLEELIQIDGVTLQVNGRKTTNPVSWIYGGGEYKELLTKLGFKFSAKKDGYWMKGIAA